VFTFTGIRNQHRHTKYKSQQKRTFPTQLKNKRQAKIIEQRKAKLKAKRKAKIIEQRKAKKRKLRHEQHQHQNKQLGTAPKLQKSKSHEQGVPGTVYLIDGFGSGYLFSICHPSALTFQPCGKSTITA